MISILHLIRRAPAVCVRPPQSTQLATNIRNSLLLGVLPSALPVEAFEELMQRPGVLATPRDLEAWADIGVLRESKALRAALEGFASADTPVSHKVAYYLLLRCANMHTSKNAVAYLARHLHNAPPAMFTASQCIEAICRLVAYHHPQTDPVYVTLIAKIKEGNAACDTRLLAASTYFTALRPLFTPAFLAGVVQDLRGGVYKPSRAAAIVLGMRFVMKGDTVRDLCNAMWRSHSSSMRPKDLFKLIEAGGNLDDMRLSLSERSDEFLKVVRQNNIYNVVALRRWDVGALQLVLETALLPTVSHKKEKALLRILGRQVVLRRFNTPLTKALAEALGPKHMPLYLACTVLFISGYNGDESALTHPRPFLDAVLAAGPVVFRKLKDGITLSNLINTLVTMRQRGHPDALVGDALAATAAWVAARGALPSLKETKRLASLRFLKPSLTHTERRTLWDSILSPMYRRILEGLSTASVEMAAIALRLAPSRDIGRIGQRLVAATGDLAEAFRGIPTCHVIWMARRALHLRSSVDVAHIIRHFTHWSRMHSRLSQSQSVAALRVLTMASRVNPPVLRKMFIDVRCIVAFLDSRNVTRVLIAMARCHCVDTALLDGLMVRALVIAPSWHDNNIAPAILAMAHLRVVCLPVVKALVRRLRTFPVGIQRRHAPKVVEALAALIA